MDPVTAGIVAGGVGSVGTLLSGFMNRDSAESQMNFQADMSNTAHQREVEDLRKAGLNPILSALGSGASTPGGAQSTMGDLGEGISKGMDTAIAVKTMNKELQAKDSGIANMDADTKNKEATSALIANQAAQTAQDTRLKSLNSTLLEKTMKSMIKKAEAEGDYSEVNQIMGIINSGASSAGQLINPFKGMINFPGKK